MQSDATPASSLPNVSIAAASIETSRRFAETSIPTNTALTGTDMGLLQQLPTLRIRAPTLNQPFGMSWKRRVRIQLRDELEAQGVIDLSRVTLRGRPILAPL